MRQFSGGWRGASNVGLVALAPSGRPPNSGFGRRHARSGLHIFSPANQIGCSPFRIKRQADYPACLRMLEQQLLEHHGIIMRLVTSREYKRNAAVLRQRTKTTEFVRMVP